MIVKRSILEKSSASVLLVTAVALVFVGMGRFHEVWKKGEPERVTIEIPGEDAVSLELPSDVDPLATPPPFGPPPTPKPEVTDISDLELVVEATKTGVIREEDKLYFTGQQQCLT